MLFVFFGILKLLTRKRLLLNIIRHLKNCTYVFKLK